MTPRGVVLGRLKAFDESGLRKLAQDPTVELFLPSPLGALKDQELRSPIPNL